MQGRFVAIDFETATAHHGSACAVGLAACTHGHVVRSCSYLIRPPGRRFSFSDLHGLTWLDVAEAPTFADLWPELEGWLDAADFVAAHNAKFDLRVLRACCARNQIRCPRKRFVCTLELAKQQWGISPAGLPDVCRRLRIPLRHHDPVSDALACARIVLAAQREGWDAPGPSSRRSTRL